MHIAGVVVLYYPQSDVIDNILSYLPDLDVLYVIDNSEQCNEQVVEQLKQFANVQYIALGENRGIAYALNLALQKSASYDYLLTMDQDSRFFAGEFKKYKKKILRNTLSNIAIFGVNYISQKENYGGKCEDAFMKNIITSGSIVNVQETHEIGGFNVNLFIDGVDTEYCYRIRSKGYNILRFGDIFMEHHIGAPTMHRFLWKRHVSCSNHSAVRRYYITRNNIYLFFTYRHQQGLQSMINVLLKDPIKILLYENGKKRKFKAIAWGILDAIKGNMGKCNRRI